MEEELNQLLVLNELDTKIFNLRKANKDLPIKIAALKGEVEQAKNKLEHTLKEIGNTETKIKDIKVFIEDEKSILDKSSHRLENISTNKEYDAIHSEIATHKKNIEESQANLLHYQQILENLKTDSEAVKEKFNAVEAQNGPILDELMVELNSLEARIQVEKDKSVAPRAKISKRLLSVYDRILVRRKNPYIIATVNLSNQVCTICNRTQPPQKINELSRMNSIHTCETCGSILIWNESEKEEVVG